MGIGCRRRVAERVDASGARAVCRVWWRGLKHRWTIALRVRDFEGAVSYIFEVDMFAVGWLRRGSEMEQALLAVCR